MVRYVLFAFICTTTIAMEKLERSATNLVQNHEGIQEYILGSFQQLMPRGVRPSEIMQHIEDEEHITLLPNKEDDKTHIIIQLDRIHRIYTNPEPRILERIELKKLANCYTTKITHL